MRCPFCGWAEQKVLDSRPARGGEAIRRRRECQRCKRRFNTFEESEKARLVIVKRSGARQDYSREKLLASMIVACRKRPVSQGRLYDATSKIERALFDACEQEIPSSAVGERVMAELEAIDPVAYVRFASVYQKFQSVSDFKEIAESVNN